MGDIIQFPVFAERSWDEIEAIVRAEMLKVGWLPSTLDWICADLKPRFLAIQAQERLECQVSPECLPAVQSVFDAAQKRFHEMSTRMLFEMVRIETELYRAKFVPNGDGPPEPPEGAKFTKAALAAFSVIHGGKDAQK